MKNKLKLLAVLFLIIGITKNSNAQVNYGIKAGLNYSAQSELSNLYDGQNYKPGYIFGLTLGYDFNPILSLNTEVSYQTKGGCNQNNYNMSINNATYQFNYLNIPIYLKAKLSEQHGIPKNWGIYGYAGPYYGRLLSTSSDIDESEQTTGTIDDYASETDYGAVLGIGVSRKVNSVELYTDLRYEMGMSEIISYDNKLRNKTIAFCVGIRF